MVLVPSLNTVFSLKGEVGSILPLLDLQYPTKLPLSNCTPNLNFYPYLIDFVKHSKTQKLILKLQMIAFEKI